MDINARSHSVQSLPLGAIPSEVRAQPTPVTEVVKVERLSPQSSAANQAVALAARMGSGGLPTNQKLAWHDRRMAESAVGERRCSLCCSAHARVVRRLCTAKSRAGSRAQIFYHTESCAQMLSCRPGVVRCSPPVESHPPLHCTHLHTA